MCSIPLSSLERIFPWRLFWALSDIRITSPNETFNTFSANCIGSYAAVGEIIMVVVSRELFCSGNQFTGKNKY